MVWLLREICGSLMLATEIAARVLAELSSGTNTRGTDVWAAADARFAGTVRKSRPRGRRACTRSRAVVR